MSLFAVHGPLFDFLMHEIDDVLGVRLCRLYDLLRFCPGIVFRVFFPALLPGSIFSRRFPALFGKGFFHIVFPLIY